MDKYKYTPKQEAFCQAYVRLGSMTEAYKEAYNCTNAKQRTIGVKASILLKTDKMAVRVKQIRDELEDRNRVTIDELVKNLANMIRFDPAQMYDENGGMKLIHDMPLEVRQMITALDIDQLYDGFGKDREQIGMIKKVKLINKLDAIEKLMKHLGAYEKDNNQRTPSEVVIFQLPDNGRK